MYKKGPSFLRSPLSWGSSENTVNEYSRSMSATQNKLQKHMWWLHTCTWSATCQVYLLLTGKVIHCYPGIIKTSQCSLRCFENSVDFFLALGTSCLHPATLAVNETSACSGHLRLPLIKWLAWRATPVTHFRLVPCPFYLSSFGCCWMSAHSLLGGVQTA